MASAFLDVDNTMAAFGNARDPSGDARHSGPPKWFSKFKPSTNRDGN